MKKRQRKGTAKKSARRASTSQPHKRRPAKRRAVLPVVVTDPDDDVWTGPARATVTTRQLTLDEDDDVWTGPARKTVTLDRLEVRTVNDGSEYSERAGHWVCRYGCVGLKLIEDSPMIHHYACPFWEREGKALAPF